MKKYLYDYIKNIDSLIKEGNITNEIIENHLIKIGFFQHERLIHLLVTLTYAIALLLLCFLVVTYPLLYIAIIIVTIFLIFYVKHYFHLENGVQYLYKQYDQLRKLIK